MWIDDIGDGGDVAMLTCVGVFQFSLVQFKMYLCVLGKGHNVLHLVSRKFPPTLPVQRFHIVCVCVRACVRACVCSAYPCKASLEICVNR